jgi:ribosomal protein S18 acetylase RimI-like enzyme
LTERIRIRRAISKDAPAIESGIIEWLHWKIPREASIKRAMRNGELLVAANRDNTVVGFIHTVLHEDIIDGGLNCFITSLYVDPTFRNKGIGSRLLKAALATSIKRGVVGVETSTASPDARRFYEAHHFRQFMGDWTMGEVFLELEMKAHTPPTQG